jgi:hypothetical protein
VFLGAEGSTHPGRPGYLTDEQGNNQSKFGSSGGSPLLAVKGGGEDDGDGKRRVVEAAAERKGSSRQRGQRRAQLQRKFESGSLVDPLVVSALVWGFFFDGPYYFVFVFSFGWSTKIHRSILFVFDNNCSTVD